MMLTQVRTATVVQSAAVRTRDIAAVPVLAFNVDQEPKVFTTGFIKRLQALNEAVRWLRAAGHAPRSIHLQGRHPMIQVDAKAANLLVAESSGYNWKNVDAGVRVCSVILKGCAITWYEVMA